MLEIGNVYRDTKEKACNSTYLEYIGSDILGCPYFKYVAGVRSYEEHNGRIFIGSNPYLYSVDEKEVFGKDFAQEVAKTVVKFKKVSEKQAYIIARAYAENNGY